MQIDWPRVEGGFAARLQVDVNSFLNDIEETELIK